MQCFQNTEHLKFCTKPTYKDIIKFISQVPFLKTVLIYWNISFVKMRKSRKRMTWGAGKRQFYLVQRRWEVADQLLYSELVHCGTSSPDWRKKTESSQRNSQKKQELMKKCKVLWWENLRSLLTEMVRLWDVAQDTEKLSKWKH